MSTSTFILQQSPWALPLLGVLARTSIAAVLLYVFRPLLVGVLRAALLVVRPRLTLEQRKARAHMRDMRLLEKMIAAASGPSDAAELRAIAARA
ncbi:MAG: hypothetical protein V4484_04865 [Pseudomonadota bacterium]